MKKIDAKFVKKKRKPRGIKLNGQESYNLCPHCFARNCDPWSMSTRIYNKIHKRLNLGLCVACGHSPCTCKSSLNV